MADNLSNQVPWPISILTNRKGYTGKLTAEHIATSLPTDLKWAIAGRSTSKLEAVAADCKTLNPDRIQPGMFPRKVHFKLGKKVNFHSVIN